MRNKNMKLIFTMLLAIFCIVCMANSVFATDNWDTAGFYKYNNANLETTTNNIMGTGIQVIRVVGTGISVIMLTYVAIKYMSAAPSEKAEFKRSATIYIVGAILVFGATQVLGIINDFAGKNVQSTQVTTAEEEKKDK